MPAETLTRPVSALEARVAALPREALIRGVLTLAWYANAENAEDEMDGDAFIPGTSSLADDGGARARRVLKEIGVRK